MALEHRPTSGLPRNEVSVRAYTSFVGRNIPCDSWKRKEMSVEKCALLVIPCGVTITVQWSRCDFFYFLSCIKHNETRKKFQNIEHKNKC